ncbi:hypothetical protein M422DRAFT_36352 [Sphaerobolus stellatus SS14]|uniref:Uncharacterized protein n=1 Tax=Sphaerobolus stellatus (strain SS14) TaxID=990650 RepID=A0A0C9V0T6_SPHS4|nr:hypothetical protein M422DRAFT_36352 [Sphaerobolus stellatus SS14]
MGIKAGNLKSRGCDVGLFDEEFERVERVIRRLAWHLKEEFDMAFSRSLSLITVGGYPFVRSSVTTIFA